MPRQVHEYKIFVASPSDVKEERELLEEVVNELNLSRSKSTNIKLELVKWETHVKPGIGKDAQSVINEQIDDEYDVFVGIMWHKFGSPTSRSESGTIEEFERAIDKYKTDNNRVKIMMYFKDGSVSPSNIDAEQLLQVQKFKKNASKLGILYKEFNESSEFEKLCRIHLSQQMDEWHRNNSDNFQLVKESNNKIESEINTELNEVEDEELGIYDYLESYQENFGVLNEVVYRMNDALEEYDKNINKMAEEAKTFSNIKNGNPKIIKDLTFQTAKIMDDYVIKTKQELPFFKKSMNDGFNALIKGITLASNDFVGNENELDELKNEIDIFLSTLSNTIIIFENLRNTTDCLPRLTKTLNKSKRSVIKVLDSIIDEIDSGKKLAAECIKMLENKTFDISVYEDIVFWLKKLNLKYSDFVYVKKMIEPDPNQLIYAIKGHVTITSKYSQIEKNYYIGHMSEFPADFLEDVRNNYFQNLK